MRNLVKVVFPPRMLGFLLAVLVTSLSWYEALNHAWIVALLVVCLLYPPLSYLVQARWHSSSHQVRKFMMIDAVLVALLITANQFYLFTALTFVLFLTVSAGIIGGVRGSLEVCLVALMPAAALSQLSFATELRPTSAMELVIAGFLMVYFGFLAWLVYRETGQLYGTTRRAKTVEVALKRESASLSRYLSPQLLDTLRGDHPIVTRRRRLTLCFTDLMGFTTLMDRLPEHEMTIVLNEYLDAMAVIALEHGGTVDKFLGDGLMVFFGDPESQGPGQDAVACLNMALAMRKRLREMSRAWCSRGLNNDLKMRVGIHTGYCAVGNFGAESRMDYTAIGGAVNIASRLESMAPAGGILISEATASLIQNQFHLSEFKVLKLKGIRESICCAEVVSCRSHRKLPAILNPAQGVRIEFSEGTEPELAYQALLEAAENILGYSRIAGAR